MALNSVHISEVPNLDQVPENASLAISSGGLLEGVEDRANPLSSSKFVVIGHRGSGMNLLSSLDPRMKAYKENSIASFNAAGNFGVDYIEFDVQVTRDNYPIIFHDNFLLTEEKGTISEKRVTELTLEEFMCYGPQKESQNIGKPLFRKARDGKISRWNVEEDDSLCTLQEAFQLVNPSLGFNIELKFDDHIVYQEEELMHILQSILKIVFTYANGRSIIFSSFQPDAAQLIRKMQSAYPVFFLTNGGSEVYADGRRNSLDEAVKHCIVHNLHGIVSEVKAIFRNPATITRIKEAKLGLLTYGQLNNVPEAVYLQHLMGIDGVIVDLVREITEAVSKFIIYPQDSLCNEEDKQTEDLTIRPKFSQHELSFLLKLIPELIQVQS